MDSKEMEEKELWMKKLKEKLDDYSEPIPALGWEQLEKELKPAVEKKLIPFRHRAVTVAAAVLLALVSSLSLYFLGTPAADDIRHTSVLASSPDALPKVQQPDETGGRIEPTVRTTVKNRLAKVKAVNRQPAAEVNLAPVTVSEGNPTQEEAVVAKDAAVTPTSVSAEKKSTNESSTRRVYRPSGRDKLHLPVEKMRSRQGWAMGLSVGNSGGTSTQVAAVGGGYMSRVDVVSATDGLLQIPNDQTLVFEAGVPYLRRSNQVVDIEHHQPISFGLNVRKNLEYGLSVETGLTYTLLSSDAKLSGNEQKIEQKLHYLGIPLRVNWNFVDNKLFTFYVSGGGMVEKCLYGKLGSEEETVKPLQLSVTGAVGAQFNATKRVGIYVEPGVAYFFDDGSNTQTIRKQNPFNFNIQAGIRLTY